MRRPFHFTVTLIVFAALLSGASGATAQDSGPQPILVPEGGSPLTTAFTYQGVLKVGSTPFNGTCQKLDFYLFDVANPPNGYPQLGLIQLPPVPVSNGLLNVSLDFGSGAFNGDRRWLQIQHDCNNTGGTFIMTPTQELTASPYAFFAPQAGNATLLDGQDSSAFSLTGHTHSGADITSGIVAEAPIHSDLARDNEVIPIVLNGDGSGSTLNADFLDGLNFTAFATASHTHSGADITSTVQTAVTATVALDVNCVSGCVSASEIITSGLTVPTATVALSATAAPWGGLTGIPADLADGDNDTQYTAGNGLTLSGVSNTVFSVITDGITANMVQFNYAGSASEGGPATSALTATMAPWVGLTGVPAGFADNVDNDTQYTAGDGLTLGGVGNTVFSVITGGITSSMILTNTIISTNVDSTSIQLRVKGPCAVGSAIRDIAANGLVTCEEVSPLPVFTTSPLDTTDDVGSHTSIIIGVDGLGLISYYDATATALKVAHCDTVTCTSATITTLDNAADVGQYSSITIGKDGLGLISYYDATNGNLKVAHCQNVACTATSITPVAPDTVGNASDIGQFTSVVIDATGNPLISYYDATATALRVLSCSASDCSGVASALIIDNSANVGKYSSATIGVDGFPLISYFDDTFNDLKVVHCGDAVCSPLAPGFVFTSVDTSGANVGQFTSITIGQDGLGLISYADLSTPTDGDLKVAHCDTIACTTAISNTIDALGNVGRFTAVTIGSDGLPIISYYDADTNTNLKVAHCSDRLCDPSVIPPTVITLDAPPGSVGEYTSVTIGVDGMPLISYRDATSPGNGDLKVAHCSNTLCIPFFRRR